MTFRRATRKAAAIVALLAFLSQSVLALAAPGYHAIHPSVPAPAMSIHESHAITLRDHADERHESLHHHAAAETQAVESACDDGRSCLCCIGSCASVLLNSAADPQAASRSGVRLCSLESLLSRTSATPYRPPISL